jgi:hypothetical protein
MMNQDFRAPQARRFFEQAIGATKVMPAEVTTDKAPACPAVLKVLLPARRVQNSFTQLVGGIRGAGRRGGHGGVHTADPRS